MSPRSAATGSGSGAAHGAASYRGTRRHRPPHKSDSASGSTRAVAEARPQRNVRTESRAKADARKQPHVSRLRKSSGHSSIGGRVRLRTATGAPTSTSSPRATPDRRLTDALPAPGQHPTDAPPTPNQSPRERRIRSRGGGNGCDPARCTARYSFAASGEGVA